MATNLALDNHLIEEAVKLGKHRTKKEAVTAALREYIRSRRRLRILAMFGKVDYAPGYQYKALRMRKRT
jgi:hypothetical protein